MNIEQALQAPHGAVSSSGGAWGSGTRNAGFTWRIASRAGQDIRVETDQVVRFQGGQIQGERVTSIMMQIGARYVFDWSDEIVVDPGHMQLFGANTTSTVGATLSVFTIFAAASIGAVSISRGTVLGALTSGFTWIVHAYMPPHVYPTELLLPLGVSVAATEVGGAYALIDTAPQGALPHARASRSYLRQLAETSPDDLLALIRGGQLPPEELTHAAEIAGAMKHEDVASTLLPLLEAPSAVVREGAVYGLAWSRQDPRVVMALRELAANDPSEAVRDAAKGALDD
jgi:hypothetical protein